MRYTPQKGFTLIETLVAISILVIAIAGPMTMAARGLQSSYHAKSQLVAVHLAQEAIEIVRMKRDNYTLANANSSEDWYDDSALIPDICKKDPDSATEHGCGVQSRGTMNFFSCGPTGAACRLKYDPAPVANERGIYTESDGDNSLFTRKVFVYRRAGAPAGEAVVTVKVSWRSNLFNAEKEIVLQSRIFDAYR